MNEQPVACKGCPWRTSNQGKRHPDGWYTKANMSRLWAGLRRGEGMSCHATDPGNPVSERAQDAGYKVIPEHSEVKECAGALVLQQREVMVIQEDFAMDFAAYRKARPRGLTRDGISQVVSRFVFGGTVMGGRALPKPDLNAPDVSVPWLEWTPRRRS